MHFKTVSVCILIPIVLILASPARSQSVNFFTDGAKRSAGDGDESRFVGALKAATGQAAGGSASGAGQFGLIQYVLNKTGDVTTQKSLLQGFVNLTAPRKVNGDNKENFGSFLLNPSLESRGAQVTGFFIPRSRGGRPVLRIPALSYRLGVGFTEYDKGTESISGFVTDGFFGVKMVRNNGVVPLGGGTPPSYEFGVELGPAFRLLGDGLAQADNREKLLGTNRAFFLGAEINGYMRIGTALPFVRLSYFPYGGTYRNHGSDSITKLSGFTGFQAFIGLDVAAQLFGN